MRYKNYRYLSIFFVSSIIFCAPKPPLIISIHDQSYEIENDKACLKSLWNNNLNDACECCLLQQYTASGKIKSADEIVTLCSQEKKICSAKSIESLKKSKKLAGNAPSQLLMDTLYDDVIMRPMIFDTTLLQENGQFTEQSLPKFLAQAYEEKKLTHQDFRKEACLKAKNLGTQGGYNTLQLFRITSTCSAGPASFYIIKEAREGIDEATKLKSLEKLPKLHDIIAPKTKPGLPSIALPIAYFAYPDKKALHYIAAMPSAKGKPLNDLLDNFKKNPSPELEEQLKRAFFILGKETANFHKLYSVPTKKNLLTPTLVHGDFHFFNLFFDENAGHFTFIDNESMAKSINNKMHPSVDIVKLFFMPFSINQTYQQFRDLIDGVNLEKWLNITVKNFVLGYANAYPKEQEQQVYAELKKIFNDPFSIAWVDFNENQLNDIRTRYINPIFDQLMNNKTKKI